MRLCVCVCVHLRTGFYLKVRTLRSSSLWIFMMFTLVSRSEQQTRRIFTSVEWPPVLPGVSSPEIVPLVVSKWPCLGDKLHDHPNCVLIYSSNTNPHFLVVGDVMGHQRERIGPGPKNWILSTNLFLTHQATAGKTHHLSKPQFLVKVLIASPSLLYKTLLRR